MNDNAVLLDNLETHFRADDLVQRIIVFGSLARDDYDAWSDLDLIIVARDTQCFARIFANLRNAKPMLYHAPPEFQPEPVGSHVLGIMFADEHPFHCLDLNFMTEAACVPTLLERFGVCKERFSRTSGNVNQGCDMDLSDLSKPSLADKEIGLAVHWSKKATKRYLRKTESREEALIRMEQLRLVLSRYPPDVQVPNGQIGQVGRNILQVCQRLLSD